MLDEIKKYLDLNPNYVLASINIVGKAIPNGGIGGSSTTLTGTLFLGAIKWRVPCKQPKTLEHVPVDQ
jgi:hypothetical protein